MTVDDKRTHGLHEWLQQRQMCWMNNARESNVDERQSAKESNTYKQIHNHFFPSTSIPLHLYNNLHS
jgi:hypothetical protein